MSDLNQVPRRALGSTGEEISILGLGGFHVGLESQTDDEVTHLIPLSRWW